MRWVVTFLAVSAALMVAAGGALGVQGDPAWSDDLHDDLERGAGAHNAWVDSEDPQFVGDRLVRNERVTLTVSDSEGADAVYGLRTDDEMRITDVRRGPARDETMRVFASKPALEGVLRAEDPVAALGEAIASGDVRVERLVDVGGHQLAVGPGAALVGLMGAGLAAALLGVAGVGVLLSGPGLVLSRLTGSVRAAVRHVLNWLGRLVQALSKLLVILELLQLLGYEVRDRIQAAGRWGRQRGETLWASLRSGLAAVLGSGTPAERESGGQMYSQIGTLRARLAAFREARRRAEQGSESGSHGDDGQ